MSEICECRYPIIHHGDDGKHCVKCHHWWMPEHGSVDLDDPKHDEKWLARKASVEKLEKQLAAYRMEDRCGEGQVRRGKPKRNAICPYCRSGKKFKKCCGKPAQQTPSDTMSQFVAEASAGSVDQDKVEEFRRRSS